MKMSTSDITLLIDIFLTYTLFIDLKKVHIEFIKLLQLITTMGF